MEDDKKVSPLTLMRWRCGGGGRAEIDLKGIVTNSQ